MQKVLHGGWETRTLSPTAAARPRWPKLRSLYEPMASSQTKEALSFALAQSASIDELDEVADILRMRDTALRALRELQVRVLTDDRILKQDNAEFTDSRPNGLASSNHPHRDAESPAEPAEQIPVEFQPKLDSTTVDERAHPGRRWASRRCDASNASACVLGVSRAARRQYP